MHLQAANRRVMHLSTFERTLAPSSQTDTLVFERVVGSLGESLDAETYEYDAVKSPLSVDVEVVEVDSREERRGESMEMTPVSPSSGCAERSSA